METIYYDHKPDAKNDESFARGFAVRIDVNDWGLDEIEKAPSIEFTANTYCAIVLLDILKDAWQDLPAYTGGPRLLEEFEETTIAPTELKKAATALRKYADTIPGAEKDTDLKWAWTEDKEYRIVIDMVKLKTDLLELAQFVEDSAKEKNKSVEFWV